MEGKVDGMKKTNVCYFHSDVMKNLAVTNEQEFYDEMEGKILEKWLHWKKWVVGGNFVA